MVSIRNSRVQVVIRDIKEQFYGYQEVITSPPRRLLYGRRVVRGIWSANTFLVLRGIMIGINICGEKCDLRIG